MLALLWRFTPLSEMVSPERFAEWFAPFRHTAWAPLLAILGLALLSSIGVPVTILILASGLAMGTCLGSACALAGSALGAMMTFEVARRVGGGKSRKLAASRRARAIAENIDRRGFLAVAALRIIPIAPFVIVNLVAGSSRIRRRDFLLATVLAMIPGTIVIVYYGSRLAEFIDGASAWALVAIVVIIGAVIALAWWLERNLDRPRRLSDIGGGA